MTGLLIGSYGLDRKSKADLLSIWRDLSGITPDPKWTKSDLATGIRNMIEKRRNEKWVEAQKPRRPPSLCEITAGEVNEWLRTLPKEKP